VERNVEKLEMDNSELRSRVEEETRNKLSFEDAKRYFFYSLKKRFKTNRVLGAWKPK